MKLVEIAGTITKEPSLPLQLTIPLEPENKSFCLIYFFSFLLSIIKTRNKIK